MNKKVATAPLVRTDQFNFQEQKILWNFYFLRWSRFQLWSLCILKEFWKKFRLRFFWIFHRSIKNYYPHCNRWMEINCFIETQQVLQMRLRIGTDNDNLIFSRKPKRRSSFFCWTKNHIFKKQKSKSVFNTLIITWHS